MKKLGPQVLPLTLKPKRSASEIESFVTLKSANIIGCIAQGTEKAAAAAKREGKKMQQGRCR